MPKSSEVNYSLPSGFIELLPTEKRLEQWLLDVMRRKFELYGYSPIETPAVERLEVLQAKGNQGDNLVIIGQNEVAAEIATLKNLQTGEQIQIPIECLVREIKVQLDNRDEVICI